MASVFYCKMNEAPKFENFHIDFCANKDIIVCINFDYYVCAANGDHKAAALKAFDDATMFIEQYVHTEYVSSWLHSVGETLAGTLLSVLYLPNILSFDQANRLGRFRDQISALDNGVDRAHVEARVTNSARSLSDHLFVELMTEDDFKMSTPLDGARRIAYTTLPRQRHRAAVLAFLDGLFIGAILCAVLWFCKIGN